MKEVEIDKLENLIGEEGIEFVLQQEEFSVTQKHVQHSNSINILLSDHGRSHSTPGASLAHDWEGFLSNDTTPTSSPWDSNESSPNTSTETSPRSDSSRRKKKHHHSSSKKHERSKSGKAKKKRKTHIKHT